MKLNILNILIATAFLFVMNSCMLFLVDDHHPGHGKHKGWYKNTNNPHHPFSTNPGHKKKHKKHDSK